MLNPVGEVHEFDNVSEHSATSSTRRSASRKTREELNEIEKQRTKRINGHIMSLRNLLEMSNILTKKDKFSVLKNTHDYIIKLRQALHLAEERIAKLNRSRSSGSGDGAHSRESDGAIPFDNLFMNSAVGMALTGVDGQFISCNDAFSVLSGFSKQEIRNISVFNFTLPEEMNQLFHVVGSMLSNSNQNVRHFWKTCKFREKEETCFVSMWLIRQDDGEPAYFQLMMVPLSECTGAIGVPTAGGAAIPSSTFSSKVSAPVRYGQYNGDLSGYVAEEAPYHGRDASRGPDKHSSLNLMGPPGAVMKTSGIASLGRRDRDNEPLKYVSRKVDSSQEYASYAPPNHSYYHQQHLSQVNSSQQQLQSDAEKYDDISHFAGSGEADCWSPGVFGTLGADYDDVKGGY